MHVALYSPAWPLAHHPNGVVTYVHWMREELRRQGHKVSILAGVLDPGHEEAGVYAVRRTPIHRARAWLHARMRPAHDLVYTWGHALADTIASIHRHEPIDVVEMEESFGWFADVARRTRIPLVVKLHGPAFMSLVEEELDSPAAHSKIDREGRALQGASFITSPARCTLDETMSRYALRPRLARHIVNPLQLPPTVPVWSLERCNRKMLLFVGRFDKRKGGDLVLEAFSRLLAERPELELTFVGPDGGIPASGGGKVHISQMIGDLFPRDGARRVHYRGPLDPVEIYRLRAEALVTLIASRWENQSYTALEAMLQGCPLVTCDSGGQAEIVADGVNGLLARTGSVDELHARVRTLVDTPDLAAALGRQARIDASANHGPMKVVTQTLEVYRQAIAAGRGS